MESNPFGVYISIRNTDGVLVSANRATAQEVLQDVPGLLELLDAVAGPEAPEPTMSASEVAAALGATGGPAQNPAPIPAQYAAAPQGNFEQCPKCKVGTKDKWVPPGVSARTQKPYPGFFGCNNPSCR